ncbi:MAG: hypothetical protein Q8Q08_00400 [Candidatus Omnitrophota bacterium]|nr:hypothetical protein [Candidatus Omnitrophota bacterium]
MVKYQVSPETRQIVVNALLETAARWLLSVGFSSLAAFVMSRRLRLFVVRLPVIEDADPRRFILFQNGHSRRKISLDNCGF